MWQENVEIVRQHIEAYAHGDAERALSFAHPEVEVDISRMDTVDEDTFHGHAALAQMVRTWRGTFRDFRFEIRRLVDVDDVVVGLVREAGRGKASGIATERLNALVYTLSAGKIVRLVQYPRDTEALEAAGLRE
jgi:ketosteroid isomerase-like protein